MLYDQILVRFGDLTLKGKNQKDFLKRLYALIANKLAGLEVEIENTFDRVYIHLNGIKAENVIERLKYVSGISSYSLVVRCSSDLAEIKKYAKMIIDELISRPTTFKIETKRADKDYHLTSPEVTKQVSAYVLATNKLLKTDVHNPEITLHIELKNHSCYLYTAEYKAMGGYPVGVAGKGLLMLSGGIDSPVAGYLAMKQGVEIECVHFESTPLTSIESAQKVVDLVKKLALYAPENKINVHFVPFKKLHMALLDNVPESYNITIMRRMMYRIAAKLAEIKGCLCLINGESVGQVASQTLMSMKTINDVTNYLVLRPLCTFDKTDIIKLSRDIDCYELSIKPFEDCCTVYLPKSPATAPKIEKAQYYETLLPYQELVDEAVFNTNSFTIQSSSDLDFTLLGLEVSEVLRTLKNQ